MATPVTELTNKLGVTLPAVRALRVWDHIFPFFVQDTFSGKTEKWKIWGWIFVADFLLFSTLLHGALFLEVMHSACTHCSSSLSLHGITLYRLLKLSKWSEMFPCITLSADLFYNNRTGNCNVNYSSLHCNPLQYRKMFPAILMLDIDLNLSEKDILAF